MSFPGRLEAARSGSAENTPTAPNGYRKPAKAGFPCVFQGVQKPAFAGFLLNLRVGPPESVEAALRAAESAFLDGKRGSLTERAGLLSVLFGGRIRLLEEPDSFVFLDTFRAGSGPKVPCFTLWSRQNRLRKWPEK